MFTIFQVSSDQLVSAMQCVPNVFKFLCGFYCTKSLDPADSASAGYAVGAEVKPSIPGQKQVKYGAKCGDHFWLLCKPA